MKKIKVLSVEWSNKEIDTFIQTESLMERIEYYVEKAEKAAGYGAGIIVFPAFTGCLYQLLETGTIDNYRHTCSSNMPGIPGCNTSTLNNKFEEYFLNQIMNISHKYEILICPGSYWSIEKNPETEGNKIYHESCIIANGNIVLRQRQLYLARWERQLGLSRGLDVELTEVREWKIGIVLSTDVFYPQVSRKLALMGVDIVLSPVGFIGKRNMALQISGMWQETQQNLFFAVESGYNGRLGEVDLWGESIIHAPLEMTRNDDGFLARTNREKSFIISELDNDMRKAAISRFNVLAGLNPALYHNMGLFGGES